MSGRKQELAVLFADISGSSDIYVTLGDEAARRVVRRCVKLMTGELPDYQGTLIKVIGDEIMCTFPSAESAFHAACAIQRKVESTQSPDGTAMHIRVGFHFGEVLQEPHDIYGDTVNVAARVVSITRARQIVVTQAVVDRLPSTLRERVTKLERVEFKGKPATFEIYLVDWAENEDSRTRVGSPSQRKA
ncbi:MAG: adenylate/guanylate cyclase domain-containing protein [Gallionella sp.]